MTKGTSTENGYRVEARETKFSHLRPVVLNDGVIGPDWREIHFDRTNDPAGIPVERWGYKDKHDLLTYEGAMALAWTLIAQNNDRFIETRLVCYSVQVSFTCEKVGVIDMEPITVLMDKELKFVQEPEPKTE